jgi:hypothetical protein
MAKREGARAARRLRSGLAPFPVSVEARIVRGLLKTEGPPAAIGGVGRAAVAVAIGVALLPEGLSVGAAPIRNSPTRTALLPGLPPRFVKGEAPFSPWPSEAWSGDPLMRPLVSLHGRGGD